MKRRLALAFVALSVFVITIRQFSPEIDVHRQLGNILHYPASNLPEPQLVLEAAPPQTNNSKSEHVLEVSHPQTASNPQTQPARPTESNHQTESNPYYSWATHVPEGNIRQRLAEFIPYDPHARYNRNVIQTWYTRDDPKLQGYFGTWDQVLPDFNHILYINDGTEVEFVQSFSDTLHDVSRTYFDLLKLRIIRSDYFKYLAVWRQGGIWSDMDSWAQQPFDNWLTSEAYHPNNLSITELEQKIGMVVGIEYWGPDKLNPVADHQHWQFATYVFAAKQGHPVLLELIAEIVERAGYLANLLEEEKLNEDDVIKETGPLMFTSVVEQWIRKRYDASFNFRHDLPNMNQSPTLIGDVLILPHLAFSGYVARDDPRAYIGHATMGSWRKNP